MSVETVMQVVGWVSLLVGLLVTIRQTAKSSQSDQVALERRLTKMESTLENINNAIVQGELVARVNDIDNRLQNVERYGCDPGMKKGD